MWKERETGIEEMEETEKQEHKGRKEKEIQTEE